MGNVNLLYERLSGKNIVIIESKAYYEAYYHVLKCLQGMKRVPFHELIVRGEHQRNDTPPMWDNERIR